MKQWRRELLDKTTLPSGAIAEYTGESKATGPVTLTTYQVLTWRPDRDAAFPHLSLFQARSWGLIIYDEVHLLPAPVFRVTADLQARRRLGLTATLVREDGREGDVFALIGPKRYDVPWRDLEQRAWIATAVCTEVRVPMSEERRMEYALAERRAQFRVAAENPEKTTQVRSILARCPEGRVLIIGEYITQLEWLARELSAPLVTGKTPQIEREQLYDPFLPLLDPEGPAVVTNAALLETQDLAQLLELSRDPRVGRYLLARLSDTVALVDPGAEALLIKALRAAGHTPRTVKGVEP